MKYIGMLLVLLLGQGQTHAREWMYEAGRHGYEDTLKAAQRLGLQSTISETDILPWCTNDYSCFVITLSELRKINQDHTDALHALECTMYRYYFGDWSC